MPVSSCKRLPKAQSVVEFALLCDRLSLHMQAIVAFDCSQHDKDLAEGGAHKQMLHCKTLALHQIFL